jgi:CRP-like cAMP-binding protein
MVQQSVQIRTALERTWMIAKWPEAAVETLCRNIDVKFFHDGERAVCQDDALDAVLIAVDGVFLLSRNSNVGRRFLYGLLKPGELTGMMASLDGLPAAFDVVARGAANLLVIQGDSIRQAASSHPLIALELIAYLCRRSRIDYETLEIHSINSVRRRIAKCILWIARGQTETEEKEIVIDSRFSQEDIADMICAARQSVNKQIRQMISQGILRQRYRSLVILDRDRLARIAAADDEHSGVGKPPSPPHRLATSPK